jgi:hypothetical protein
LFHLTQPIPPGGSVTLTVETSYDDGALGSYQWSVAGATGTNGQALNFSGLAVSESRITVVQATATPTQTPTATPTETPAFTPTETPTATAGETATPPGREGIVVYPNPAMGPGPVTLQLSLSGPESSLDLEVFTTAFRKVNDIHLGQVPAGVTDWPLPLKDQWGTPLADGLYYAIVRGSGRRLSARLLVLR